MMPVCERYWVIILFESLLKNDINAEENRGFCPETFQGANFQQQLPVKICGAGWMWRGNGTNASLRCYTLPDESCFSRRHDNNYNWYFC